MVFAANGARFGFAATWPASAGYHLATWPVTFAIGLGLLRLSGEAHSLARAMQVAGAACVMWLAVCVIRAGTLRGRAEARPLAFGGGVSLLVPNPKAYVIVALMYSQFLFPDSPRGTVPWIATVFTLNNLVAFSTWTILGERLARLFIAERSAHRINLLFGGLLAGIAVWMAVA
jgi:threonine/homoserine/homoserine lactone efflux protein